MSEAAMLGGAVFAAYGVWQWLSATRRQNPRRRLRRRGQIGCVGGAGGAILGLTFGLTPQPYENAVLFAWCVGTAIVWLIHEWTCAR
jgi:hypothetical protein